MSGPTGPLASGSKTALAVVAALLFVAAPAAVDALGAGAGRSDTGLPAASSPVGMDGDRDGHRPFLAPDPTARRGAGAHALVEVTTLDHRDPAVGSGGGSPSAALVPLPVDGIGPGSYISTEMEGHGSAGCTANFVWEDPTGQLYLGTAGHCVMPPDTHSTHGPDPDWDAARSNVSVRVDGCLAEVCADGGRMVELGTLVYARQCQVDHDHPCLVGYDLALIEIPAEHHDLVRTAMPYWGEPDGQATLDAAEQGRHYGHGLGWDREGTRARAAVGIGYPFVGDSFQAIGAASFGDSGSGIMSVEGTDPTTAPSRAAGIITAGYPPASLFVGTQAWMVQETVARDRCLQVRVVPGGSFPGLPASCGT